MAVSGTVEEVRATSMPVAAPAKMPSHLQFLDGLRGIGALYIVVGHAWLSTWPIFLDGLNGSQDPAVWAWSGLVMFGHYAVTLFIVLSGFCLMIPVLRAGEMRGGVAVFFTRRARRILPPYYVALLLSIVVDLFVLHTGKGTLFSYSLPIDRFAVITHLLLIHELFAKVRVTINGPLWSTAAEAQIYLLFPLLVWLWMRRGLLAMMAASLAVSVVLLRLAQHVGDHDLVPQYVLIFAMGMAAAIYAFPHQSAIIRPPRWTPSMSLLKITGVFAAVALVAMLHRFAFHYTRQNDLLAGLAGCCLLVVGTREPANGMHRLLGWPPLVWIGSFSYSLYLIHCPVQQMFLQGVVEHLHVGKIAEFASMAIGGTVVLVPVSYGFYRLVEKPLMRSRSSTERRTRSHKPMTA